MTKRFPRAAVTPAWNLEEVYGKLLDFAKGYSFNPEAEDYLIHITTGTHVAQICLFLLTESRYLPGRLIQSSPPDRRRPDEPGEIQIIDLDLSKYDKLASRFASEQQEGTSFLKSGIETRSTRFNQLIDQIEHVAIASTEPLLLMGPTGAGKSQLACVSDSVTSGLLLSTSILRSPGTLSAASSPTPAT